MQNRILVFCCSINIWLFQLWQVSAETQTPPTPDAIGNTAEQLWRSSKFSELEKYLTIVAKKYPNRVVSHIAMGFVEQTLHQDVHATVICIKPVADALDLNRIVAPDKFSLQVSKALFVSAGFDKPEYAARNNRIKLNPEVARTRAFYGAKLPELLGALRLSPDVDLPP